MRKPLVFVLLINIILTAFISIDGSAGAKQPFNIDTINNGIQCTVNNESEIIKTDQGTTDTLLIAAIESTELTLFQQELKNQNEVVPDRKNELRLEFDESYAYQIGEIFSLYIPISGGIDHSFFALQFDKSYLITDTLAGLFRRNATNNVSFWFQVNHQLIVDIEITDDGTILGGQVFDLAGNELELASLINTEESGSWWNCMNSCLSFMGVPLYLIAGLGIVCGAVCVATAGLACGLCISAALGAWSGIGTICLAECADGEW